MAARGLFAIVIACFTFAPTRLTITLLSIFAAYDGLVLYFNAAPANPFAAPAEGGPTAPYRLVETWDG